uniref:Uncharacterized protein n=1 Tax=Oryza punctata TaxID=4537 RepID=A0A0E0KWE9_ORYPU
MARSSQPYRQGVASRFAGAEANGSSASGVSVRSTIKLAPSRDNTRRSVSLFLKEEGSSAFNSCSSYLNEKVMAKRKTNHLESAVELRRGTGRRHVAAALLPEMVPRSGHAGHAMHGGGASASCVPVSVRHTALPVAIKRDLRLPESSVSHPSPTSPAHQLLDEMLPYKHLSPEGGAGAPTDRVLIVHRNPDAVRQKHILPRSVIGAIGSIKQILSLV